MANKADRRKEILDAARQLFSEKGYHAVSLGDIAEAAGLSVGLIYYVFPKKEDILVGVVKEASILYRKVFDKIQDLDNPMEQLETVMAELYYNLDDGARVIMILYKDLSTMDKETRRQLLSLERETTAKIVGIVEDGQQQGVFTSAVSAQYVAFNLIGIGHLWALKKSWLFKQTSLATFVAEQSKLLRSTLLM